MLSHIILFSLEIEGKNYPVFQCLFDQGERSQLLAKLNENECWTIADYLRRPKHSWLTKMIAVIYSLSAFKSA